MKKLLAVNLKMASMVLMYMVIMSQMSGCAIKLVADYDATIAREIFTVSKEVDGFYGQLLETEHKDRSYDTFKDRYIKIEVDIRGLVMQNKVRALNNESISIAETTLEKWIKYKNKHKENWANFQLPNSHADKIKAKDIYKDNLIVNHRKRFTRLFTAMSVAEEAKKLNTEAPEE